MNMKLEQTNMTMGSASPARESRPVERKESAKKAEPETNESKPAPVQKQEKGRSSEEAKKIAQKLQNMVDEANIHFVVKDPMGTGVDNVVIEVRDENNKVVARIPEDVINDIHQEVVQEGGHDLPKGLLLNQMVK